MKDGVRFAPCQVAYHKRCIKAGPPFRSRFRNQHGLSYPSTFAPPSFCCELCTVRANMGKELVAHHKSYSLLMLERMRMIDMAHAWAYRTIQQYSSALKWVKTFSTYFDVPILPQTPLIHPPVTHAIPLAWAELNYSLRTTTSKSGEILPIKYSTVTFLRSAVGMVHAYDMIQRFPQQLLRDKYRRALVVPYAAPSEEAMTHFFHLGMSRRLGTQATPSWALSWIHISFINNYLELLYNQATSNEEKHNIACAGVINLIAYLGWLRAQDIFFLSPTHVIITLPVNGPTRGLPPNVGAIELRLLEATKTNQSMEADVVIAYETLSGLQPGKWLIRLRQFESYHPNLLFSTTTHHQFTSSIFRHNYVYPALEAQRRNQEPSLQCFSDAVGDRIQDKVTSMHSWRRAGRSKVSRPPRYNEPNVKGTRKATKDEIYYHGRWLIPRGREAIDHQYNQWDLSERICITMLCG